MSWFRPAFNLEKFEIAIPTMDEIFIQVVTKGANPHEQDLVGISNMNTCAM
jgi:hypothetical protein